MLTRSNAISSIARYNPSWNRDDLLVLPERHQPGRARRWSAIVYWPGEPDFNDSPSFYPNGAAIWDQRPIFAAKTTDRAYYPILWTDINRKYLGTWGRPGDPNPLTMRRQPFQPGRQ